ncbi:MAG TPA: hypothetical protein VFU93_04805 [Acidimicrobiales bacterium]|nr:hypothetical protein [Acidimicrobiales bacterium]
MSPAAIAATAQVAAVQTWPEIRADVSLNWYIYLSMPLVAALVGYGTKVVALQMIYRPLEFRGIGPIGWQGVVPRRAGKTAAVTLDLITERLLRPEELLDRVDAAELVEELRGPLVDLVDELARDLCSQLRPGLWDAVPELGRRAVVARVQRSAPRVVDRLLADMRTDLSRYIDIQYLAVNILVRNKQQLNDLVRGIGRAPLRFIRRSGIYFGLAIGTVQMVAWGVLHEPWIMPAFGLFVGFASDWLALNLIFMPREQRLLFGRVPVQGVIPARREQITRDYARIIARDILSPDVLLDGLLHGPTSDRLFAALDREISEAVDDELGLARPALALAIGTQRYRDLKVVVVERLVDHLPGALDSARDYAERTLGLEELIVEKLDLLTPDEFEGILRPVFKDDELLMVTVGALLGFAVGELQVVLVEHLSR